MLQLKRVQAYILALLEQWSKESNVPYNEQPCSIGSFICPEGALGKGSVTDLVCGSSSSHSEVSCIWQAILLKCLKRQYSIRTKRQIQKRKNKHLQHHAITSELWCKVHFIFKYFESICFIELSVGRATAMWYVCYYLPPVLCHSSDQSRARHRSHRTSALSGQMEEEPNLPWHTSVPDKFPQFTGQRTCQPSSAHFAATKGDSAIHQISQVVTWATVACQECGENDNIGLVGSCWGSIGCFRNRCRDMKAAMTKSGVLEPIWSHFIFGQPSCKAPRCASSEESPGTKSLSLAIPNWIRSEDIRSS